MKFAARLLHKHSEHRSPTRKHSDHTSHSRSHKHSDLPSPTRKHHEHSSHIWFGKHSEHGATSHHWFNKTHDQKSPPRVGKIVERNSRPRIIQGCKSPTRSKSSEASASTSVSTHLWFGKHTDQGGRGRVGKQVQHVQHATHSQRLEENFAPQLISLRPWSPSHDM